MDTILWLSIAWIVYGIIGVLGFQVTIPKQFRGQPWEKSYVRKQGLSWLLYGIPFLGLYLLFRNYRLETIYAVILIIVCAMPSLIFTRITDNKYKARMEKERNDS